MTRPQALWVLVGAAVLDFVVPFVPLVAFGLFFTFWLWRDGRQWVLQLLQAAAGK